MCTNDHYFSRLRCVREPTQAVVYLSVEYPISSDRKHESHYKPQEKIVKQLFRTGVAHLPKTRPNLISSMGLSDAKNFLICVKNRFKTDELGRPLSRGESPEQVDVTLGRDRAGFRLRKRAPRDAVRRSNSVLPRGFWRRKRCCRLLGDEAVSRNSIPHR